MTASVRPDGYLLTVSMMDLRLSRDARPEFLDPVMTRATFFMGEGNHVNFRYLGKSQKLLKQTYSSTLCKHRSMLGE